MSTLGAGDVMASRNEGGDQESGGSSAKKSAITKEREMDSDQAKLHELTTGKSQKWPTQSIKSEVRLFALEKEILNDR